MTQVLFSFDTEDYINPAAEEGVIRLARTLESEGARGCFCVVGELAATWRRRGSRDVLEALRPHEINAHTWRHSWHPNVVEYSEDADWHGSLARFLREERYAFDLVMDVCQRDRLWAFIKPGNSFSAQAIYGSTLLGAPIFGDSMLDARRGRGLWFCNALNLNYDFSIERLFDGGLEPFRQRLDEWATWDRLILYAHPCKTVLSEFWDGQNMFHRNPSTWGDWVYAPQRPRDQIERFFSDFRELIRLLRAHGGFEFTTYETVWREHRAAVHRQLPRERLLPLLRRAAERLTWQTADDGQTYSPAELFAAAVDALTNRPDPWGAWGVMGPVDEPQGVSEALELEAEAVRQAAQRLAPVTYVPAVVEAGRATLGPGDMLRAMAQVLAGAERVRLIPGPQLPEAADWPMWETFHTDGQWCHAPEWTSKLVDARLKWQTWTVRE